MTAIEMRAKIDTVVRAFYGLNAALWEHGDLKEMDRLIGFLEHELRVMRRSAKLLRA